MKENGEMYHIHFSKNLERKHFSGRVVNKDYQNQIKKEIVNIYFFGRNLKHARVKLH